MGEQTGIRWADATDNPIKVKNAAGKFGGFYCVKISPGCTNCYAATMVGTGRFGEPIPYVAGPNAPELYLDEEMLEGWSRKMRPKKRFVSSMTDIAGEFVPDDWYYRILDAQLAAPRQTFLDLTKRASRMMALTIEWMRQRGMRQAPAHMWMGFSAENQEWFDKRWHFMQRLYEIFGFTVWVSAEPLLGPIVLPESFLSLGKKAWVITGGESGSQARPCHPKWVYDLRDQCVAFGVPFFHKQWGEWIPKTEITYLNPDGDWRIKPEWLEAVRGKEWGCLDASGKYFQETTTWNGRQYDEQDDYEVSIYKVGKHAAGHLLDGQEWSQFPDSPILDPPQRVESLRERSGPERPSSEFTTLV